MFRQPHVSFINLKNADMKIDRMVVARRPIFRTCVLTLKQL